MNSNNFVIVDCTTRGSSSGRFGPGVPGKIRTHRAFSLIELLISVAIVGLLAALLVPIYKKTTTAAALSTSLGNLRQLYTGFETYAADNNNSYPAAYNGSASAWQYEIFDILYPGKEQKYDSSHLWKTVFISPRGLADRKARGLAIPDPTVCGYGMNRVLPSRGGGNDSLAKKNPMTISSKSQTVLLLDNQNGIAGGNSGNEQRWQLIANVKGRYDGKISTLFCDGHAEARLLESIPKLESDPFWTGMQQ